MAAITLHLKRHLQELVIPRYGFHVTVAAGNRIIYFFYIHGSVHRDSVLIRSDKMQQHAGIYILQVYSTCFGRPPRPSSGVQKTVTTASGTGHSNGAATFLRRGPKASRCHF